MFLERYRPYLGALLFIILSGWLVQIVRAAEWREPQRQPPQENPPGFVWAVPPSGPAQPGGQFHIEGSGKIGGVLDILGRTSVGGVLQSVSGIIAGGPTFGLGGDRGGQALISGTTQYEATHPEDALILLQTTAGGTATDRLRVDRDGNTTIAGRLQAGGRVVGNELCIGSECRSAWPTVVERGRGSENAVTLQPATPGTPQTGNLNISGTGTLGALQTSGVASVATLRSLGDVSLGNGSGLATSELNAGTPNFYLNGRGSVQIRVDGNNDDQNAVFRVNNGTNTTVLSVDETGVVQASRSLQAPTVCIGTDCKDAWPTPRDSTAGSVTLQPSTPGTAQTGSFNVNGTGIAAALQAGSVGITGTSASAFDVAGGIEAGTGNVRIVDATGKIPGISGTTFADLSGANLTNLNAANIASGTILDARLPTTLARTVSRTTFSATPGGAGVLQGSLVVSPLITAPANAALFGIANAGAERLRVDAEGDVVAAGKVDAAEVQASGRVTGAELCIGADCKSAWGQGEETGSIQLQPNRPGLPQDGHLNIAGDARAGALLSQNYISSLGPIGWGPIGGPTGTLQWSGRQVQVGSYSNEDVAIITGRDNPRMVLRYAGDVLVNGPLTASGLNTNGNAVVGALCFGAVGRECRTSWNQVSGGGGAGGTNVQLQSSTPGTPQVGSFSVNGTGVVGVLLAGSVGITGTQTKALDVGGGIEVGTGNVQIVDATGKIPGISGTTFADLSGANLTNLNAANIASGTLAEARLPGTLLRASVPTTFTGAPTGAGVLQGSLMVNPATANVGETLLGVAAGGRERLRVDANGNLSLAGNIATPSGTITADSFCVNTGSGGPDCRTWGNFVQSQPIGRPSTPQTGNLNLSGTGTFGSIDVDSLDTVRSRAGIDVRLDHDRATAPDSAEFRIFEGSSTTPIFTVNRWAGARMNGGLAISGGHLTTTHSVLAENTGNVVSGHELRTVSGGISSPISSGYLDLWGNATGAGTLKLRAGGLVLGGHGNTVDDYGINANGNASFGGTRLTIGGRGVLAGHRVGSRSCGYGVAQCDFTCDATEIMLSGGCRSGSPFLSSYPVDARTWSCERQTGQSGTMIAYGICARLAQ